MALLAMGILFVPSSKGKYLSSLLTIVDDKIFLLIPFGLKTFFRLVYLLIRVLNPSLSSTYSEIFGKTADFSIWSHAGLDGPTGTLPTSENGVDGKQMSVDGWGSINLIGSRGLMQIFMVAKQELEVQIPHLLQHECLQKLIFITSLFTDKVLQLTHQFMLMFERTRLK